jgi:hypothetical protein
LARTLMVSTAARSQPSRPCSPRRSKTTRWSRSNTPALAHSVRRRQQVAGEPQPSSRAGSSRHRGAGAGHVDDRGEAGAIGNGAVPAAVGRPGWWWQQRRHERPQLVRHEVVREGRHAPDPARPTPRERNDVYPRRKPDAGLTGGRLRRSGLVRISSYFRTLSNSHSVGGWIADRPLPRALAGSRTLAVRAPACSLEGWRRASSVTIAFWRILATSGSMWYTRW